MPQFTGFSDLESSFDDLEQATKPVKEKEKFPCQKCMGTGRYQGVRVHQHEDKCFACKGKGYFLTSPFKRQQRAERRAKKKANAQAIKDQARQAYIAEHKALYDFMQENAHWHSFFGSMLEAIAKYDKLTERQEAAAYASMEKCIAKRQEKEAAKNAAAPTVDLTKMHEVFKTATGNGLKKPKLRIGNVVVSIAPATGRNAGSLYVKQDGEYQGKLTPEGKFFKVRHAAEGIEESILEFCKNPLEAAIAYGKQTGVCCCCGRELTDPASIERGIGPVCESNWF